MRDIYKYDYNRTPSVNQEFSGILKKENRPPQKNEAAFAFNLLGVDDNHGVIYLDVEITICSVKLCTAGAMEDKAVLTLEHLL